MQRLILDVIDGNPGALLIIRRLMYFAPWHFLLRRLKARGLIGSRLWQVVKDDYCHNWTQFVHDQMIDWIDDVSPGRWQPQRPLPYLYN